MPLTASNPPNDFRNPRATIIASEPMADACSVLGAMAGLVTGSGAGVGTATNIAPATDRDHADFGAPCAD
jgi:hypothetical protein